MEIVLGKVVGSDGFSPKITVVSDTEETYELEIETADGSFTTPNLKGQSADTGGLSFGQDSEGNWGYIAPGADTVIPFKKGGESGGSGSGGGGYGCVFIELGFSYEIKSNPKITTVDASGFVTESAVLEEL